MTDFYDIDQNAYAPIDFRAELNDEQYAAVTAEPGPALVLAGAGSGKTRTLTYRVAYLLHQDVKPYEILLLTFTNKSAKEMLERVEELTGVKKHQLWGGTFHSIAQRILRVHGESVGLKRNYTILDETEAESLLKAAINKVDPKFIKGKNNPKPKVVHNMISYARNTCRSVFDEADDHYPFLEGMAQKIADIYKVYHTTKLEQQVVDYDDLLEYLLKLLREHPEVAAYYQERFKHILVDEFQDTNRLQSEIVDILGVHHQIMAVGGLPYSTVDGEKAKAILATVESKLLTPLGLRSLGPDDPEYKPVYSGGVLERDGAYHQGTVWPWLIGPFVEAWFNVNGKSKKTASAVATSASAKPR